MMFIMYNGIDELNSDVFRWSFLLWKQKLSMCLVSFDSDGIKVMEQIYKYQSEDSRVSFFWCHLNYQVY